MKETINIELAELIEEHKKLVTILKGGDLKARLAEAKKQDIELKEYMAKHHNKEGK